VNDDFVELHMDALGMAILKSACTERAKVLAERINYSHEHGDYNTLIVIADMLQDILDETV
jgi:hypothetical protein